MGWWWEGREVEEIRELKYLGYIFQRSSKQEKGQGEKRDGGDGTRGIGKRKFREDWGKRMGTFDALMWTVMAYGVEIWEWKEREMIEMAQEKFLK